MPRTTLMRLIVPALCCAPAADVLALPEYTVTVTAPGRDYRWAPVRAAVPGPKERDAWHAIALRQARTRALVPCSWEVLPDGKVEVTWLVEDLPQGASQTYRLAFVREAAPPGPGVTLGEPTDGAVEIRTGDELFTRYVFEGAPKPYCYPLIGPTGVPVTRSYPMEMVEGETRDHPHQRSLWFTHGEVNGIDFWAETDKTGREVHREFLALESGAACGVLRERNDWVSAEGRKVCEEVRELRVYNVPGTRLFDFTSTLTATEGPVEFGDTKEGSFGIRVASAMDVTPEHPGAHITNSAGQTDGDAWGKAAEWCDLSAPLNGTMVGISILDHPTSFRHPTYWHVRTYGLFAANPFGLRHFIGDTEGRGRLTLQTGESVTFRYRVLIHPGNVEEAKVADWYAAFADPPPVALR